MRQRIDGVIHCRVLDFEAPSRLRISWRADGLDSTVTWRLTPEGTGTRLFLTHDGFAPDDPAQQLIRGMLSDGWRSRLLPTLADLTAGRTGQLAVRYFATAGATLVAPALARLRAAHPGVRADLQLADPADPLREIRRGQAHLAVLVHPPTRPPDPGVRLVHLLDDPYAAVLPAGHPLAETERVELGALATEPWVGSEPPGPCLQPVIDSCAAAGFSPDFVVQSEDYATAQGFVAAGLGIGLMPRLGLRTPHPGVVIRPVHNPEPIRTISAAVRDPTPDQPPLRTLLHALHTTATTG
ncbi:LysR substrate-binding domain-containing protein [Streptomyces sp. DSM 44915]|uniref:LysR substrate-binding domain-containing protein n=1 Tax=Streptomyces chisholmiae TaxID=3075540 RepID=A0ABU2K190_9ACTN|nr:LysR substrate-binding domain-containing protein [Streptomyces sp. DSM 44915]MDT0270748.1 LysR substrate-binding domain-containing protein [Streptomyces sp. DSM 44915]